MFQLEKLELQDAFLIKPFYASDNRGGFVKDYNIDVFKSNNIEHELQETFYTISKKGVIRAIHFQLLISIIAYFRPCGLPAVCYQD